MAISRNEYVILRDLCIDGVVAPKPHLLELGDANWYCDVPVQELADDIHKLVNPQRRDHVMAQLVDALERRGPYMLFEIAKICYKAFFDYASRTAVDLNGSPSALKLDLNKPLLLDRQYDVVINSGTGEHVFDICQFFKTVHQWTTPSGVMIHGMPFTGLVDHGFYNFQPTFYWDLAAANCYDVIALVYAEREPFKQVQVESRENIHQMARDHALGMNSGLHVVFRKSREERPFTVPLQGYYADTLSIEAKKVWSTLR